MLSQTGIYSGTRGGYAYDTIASSMVGKCEGLLVTRGGSRVEKLIKCDLCGNVYRTSNMARHKKRYCKALVWQRLAWKRENI